MSRQNNNSNNQQVAVIQPPRMQMPATVAERYNLNEDSWRALVEGIFPLAKTVGAVLLALAYCDRNRLDIFQKVVHIVPMRVGRVEVETVWPGIAQIRVMAQRQPEFAGYDDTEFGPDITKTFKGKKQEWRQADGGKWEKSGFKAIEFDLAFPEWAQFITYKMLHGQRVRLPGPKVWFLETFSGTGEGGAVPNEKWERSPRQMLEKCAEAASYRRAFPDVLGNEMSAEEMEGKDMMGHNGEPPIDAEYVEVTGGGQQAQGGEKPKAPKRGDFQERPVDQAEVSDAVAKRNALLDGQGIPNTEEGWDGYEQLLKERLITFMSRGEVDAEQLRQQFRIDAAPFKHKQIIYDIFSDIAAELPAETRDEVPVEETKAEPAAEGAQAKPEGEPDQKDGQAADLFKAGDQSDEA